MFVHLLFIVHLDFNSLVCRFSTALSWANHPEPVLILLSLPAAGSSGDAAAEV